MDTNAQPWVKTPKLVVTVGHGKGKSVVTGRVTISFIGDGIAFVGTDGAHHNDNNPAISFRGTEWLAHEAFTRQPDGTWELTDPRANYGTVQRGLARVGSHTPTTHRAAIVEALAATVAQHWTPELDRQATYAHAAQRLHGLLPERAEIVATLAELDSRIASLQATLAATAPTDSV